MEGGEKRGGGVNESAAPSNGKSSIVKERILPFVFEYILPFVFVPLIVEEQILRLVFVPSIV